MGFYSNVSNINLENIGQLIGKIALGLDRQDIRWKESRLIKSLYIPNAKISYSSKEYYIRISSYSNHNIEYKFIFNQADLEKLNLLSYTDMEFYIGILTLSGRKYLEFEISSIKDRTKIIKHLPLLETKESMLYECKSEIQKILNRNKKDYSRKKYNINDDIDSLIDRLETIKTMI